MGSLEGKKAKAPAKPRKAVARRKTRRAKPRAKRA